MENEVIVFSEPQDQSANDVFWIGYKKKMLCALLFVFSYHLATAQANKELLRYYKIQDSALYYESIKQDDAAIACYRKLLKFSQFEVSNYVYDALAQVYLRQNKLDSAKQSITELILHDGPMEHDRFAYLTGGKVQMNIDSLNNLYPLDYALYSKIHKILWEDQALRHIDPVLGRNGVDEATRKKVFDQVDSIGNAELRKTISDLGHLPTAKEIGGKLQNILNRALIIHHFYKDTAFWAPLCRTATDNGTMERYILPYLMDRYYIQNTKEGKPIYCESPDYNDFQHMLEPLYPDKVDKMRAALYLPTLYMKAKIEKVELPKNYHYGK